MQLLQNHTLDSSTLGISFFTHAAGCVAQRSGLVVAMLLLATGMAQAGPFSDPGHPPETMVAWATQVEDALAGPVWVDSPALGFVEFGLPEFVLGPSDPGGEVGGGDVFSLGDGGHITLHFDSGIGDDQGDDFAVFENGFFDDATGLFFGEFAFVEVSTNGIDFARFAAISLQPSPVAIFGFVDDSDYLNLAGDQPLQLGTGFDLGELASHTLVQNGQLDLSDVRFVRLIDVVGDGSTVDSLQLPIFDPFPTPFLSGGFDAEAVGVLHPAPEPGFTTLVMIGLLGLVAMHPRRHAKRADTCLH